jgi:hypothetical protein
MFYDFIEIGTSDFDTEIQKYPMKRGISIEPIQYYIDRLPDSPTCTKLNMAISNYNGTGKVFYLSEETIHLHSFPSYVRGCNSVNSYHSTVSQLCREKNLQIEDIATSYDIPIRRLSSVFEDTMITGVYYLKIDTEGHDTVILKDFYETITPFTMPHVILFESNILSSISDVDEIISLYEGKGYDVIYRREDTLLYRNLTKGVKTQFTEKIPEYYIMDYPPGYTIESLPHENTLSAAKEFCRNGNYSGITLQDGIYQVRSGKYIHYCSTIQCASWVYC